MNRLKYSQKFLLVGLVLVLPLGVVLSQFLSQSNDIIDFETKEQLGLTYNRPLTTFLQHVEQYAGLVYIHAQGDNALKAKIAPTMADKQAQVEEDMHSVDVAQESLSQTFAVGTRWDDIKNEWNRDKIALPTLTEDAAAGIYSNLIHQTLVLIVVVGNNSNLILDHDIDTYYIMESLVQEIPESSSYLSDIRNYSAASAAAGTLSSTDRTRLVILGGLARFELESQQMSLGYVAAYNPSLATFLNENSSAAQSRMSAFLDRVDNEILGNAGEQQTATPLSIDPLAYFDDASTAIDSVFDSYTMLSARENGLLQTRIDRVLGQRNAVGALTLVALALAIYLFAAFYLGTRRVITSLEVASQRLITRRIDEPIGLDSRDELAQVVISFNNLAREMISARDKALEQHTLTEALLDSAMAISSTLNLGEVVTNILNNLRRVMQYDIANIMIREESQVQVLCERRYSREGSVTLLGERSLSATDERYPGSAGSFAMPLIAGNPAEGIRFKPFVEASGLNSYLFLPIVLGQSVIGYINLGSELPSYFDGQDTAYLQIFALQAGSAIQNAQLYKQARNLATLEERQRLARDLHDSVSQILFSANMMAEALPRLMDQDASNTRDYLYDMQELTRSAMLEMKSLLVELRIESLFQTDLGVLLNQLADSFTGKTQVEVEKVIQRQVILPPQTQVVFYRVAQEAFRNIASHAQAAHVKLSLQLVDKVCALHIEDDGSGFDPEATSGNKFGLKVMKERADEIQASLTVQAALGKGALIALTKHLD